MSKVKYPNDIEVSTTEYERRKREACANQIFEFMPVKPKVTLLPIALLTALAIGWLVAIYLFIEGAQ